jgi:hypothetical protein
MKLLIIFLSLPLITFAKSSFDTAKIEKLTGLKGQLNEKEGVVKDTSESLAKN